MFRIIHRRVRIRNIPTERERERVSPGNEVTDRRRRRSRNEEEIEKLEKMGVPR